LWNSFAEEKLIMKLLKRKQVVEEMFTEWQKFKTLSEYAPFGMVMIDQDGHFKYINPKFKELFGYDLSDVPDGKTWFRKAYPDSTYRHNVISTWINDLKSSNPAEKRSRTFTVTCKDGTDKIVRFITVQLEGDENLISCEDITELKQAEESLQMSEGAAKRLANENAIMAEIGRIISSTPEIEKVYELFAKEVRKVIPFDRIAINIIHSERDVYASAYIMGKDVADHMAWDIVPLAGSLTEEVVRTRSTMFIQTDDKDEVIGRFPQLLPNFQAGLQSLIAVPLISKDQVIGVLHVQSAKQKAYTERDLRFAERVGNQITGAIANAQLFAERNRAEEALQKSEKRFKELYDNAPVGYHEYDKEGCITQINRTELEMLGYTAEEMLGQPVWKFIVEKESQERVKDKLAGDRSPVRTFERTYRKKDGSTFPVLIEDRILRDSEGKVTGIRSTIQDITEQKRIEKEMAALEEQLHQSQKMEAIGQLAGGIAHDFNNLLTVIKGYSKLSLSELREGDPLKENIEEIHKASQRAEDLTRQLLAFSRRQILDFKVLDLNTFIQDLDKMLRRILGEDIELVTLLAEDLEKVKTDPGQIEQVIMNLSVNARDAMPTGGKLTIETANVELDEEYARVQIGVPPGHYVMLSVSDTGVGMSPEVKEHIFEPFFTTKEKGKGTGLGLSTVYGIVKQSRGNIWVYSEPGHGTTFKIYLPSADETIDLIKSSPTQAELPQGSETILLVEDEESVRTFAHKTLKGYGYIILEASNGEEALRLAQGHGRKINLLLTDVVMPQMSGKELADRIKILWPDIKVLFASGYTDNAIVHHGILESGIHFLQKPYTPEVLARKVREVLDR
jgi:PAS domain S-box-containing protein